MTALQSAMAAPPAEELPTLAEATRVWARIGCLSFCARTMASRRLTSLLRILGSE